MGCTLVERMGEQILLSARLVFDENGSMVPVSDNLDEIIDRSGYAAELPAMIKRD